MCDVDGKGWLSVQDLRHVSPELSDKDLDYIFRQLDGDRDNVCFFESNLNDNYFLENQQRRIYVVVRVSVGAR